MQDAVGGYFQDPTATSKKVGSDMVGCGENFVVSKDNMAQLKEQLQKAVREVPNFDKLKNHIDMTVTNEGLRIELTESASGTFYDPGSAKLNSDGEGLLMLLAKELGKLPNKIAVEGHTDAKAYAPNSNYTNWELSADRANAARRMMQEHSLGESQVSQVRGFADQRLRKPDAPLDPANRRISRIVQYLVKPEAANDASALAAAGGKGSGAQAPERKPDGAKPAEAKRATENAPAAKTP